MNRDVDSSTSSLNIVYHYPPDLLQLLIDTIPLLCKRKIDVVTFFAGAGVHGSVINTLATRVRNERDKVNKYEIARTLLVMLNDQGEISLRERREILKRVTQWEDFSTCWPDDQLKARGLVSQIQRLVQVRDTFTRIDLERETEKMQRQAEERIKREQAQKRRNELASIKKDLTSLFTQPNPQRRGKALEGILNRLFAVSGILVREAFTLKGSEGEGIVEQIDGLVEIDGRLFLVEMKWWNSPIGKGDISSHIVRLYSRPEAHGIFISASEYTDAAVAVCKDALHQGKLMVLCELKEMVFLLEQDQDIKDFLRKKIDAAIVHKNPLYSPISFIE